jgi:GntR family transcriptional regulator
VSHCVCLPLRLDEGYAPLSAAANGEPEVATAGHTREEIPRYLQVQQYLRDEIAAGTWLPGKAIASEQALAQQFHIARMTVRQAIEGLIREGLLRRERGRGTFVTLRRVERELSRMRGFSEDMLARGMVPSTKLLAREVVPAPPDVSIHLAVGQREAVIYLKRLRLADALPMALETSYFNYALFRPLLTADLESHSLYSFLEQALGFRLSHASQELAATLPSTEEAALLEQPKRHPTLVISQTTYVQLAGEELPAIFGRTLYRADRYRFRQEIPR